MDRAPEGFPPARVGETFRPERISRMAIWKRAPKSDRLLFVGSVLLLVLTLMLLGLSDRRLHAAGEDEEFYRFVDVAAEVYSEVRTKYVDEVEPRLVLEGALAGMFRNLDEHSQYMNPDMLKSLERDTSGEFSGIGIHITKRQGLLTVIAPIPGSPAADAGIQPWDRIIEIEGKTTEGMELEEAVSKLTGPAGTQVTFKVYRQGEREPMEFSVVRANVEIKSVFSQMLDDRIGYIRLSRFSENTTRDVRRAIVDFKEQGMQGLIIDLRYDSGGLLREAIDTANLFVPKGEIIVSTKGRLRSQNREYRAEAEPIANGIPLFVLVNEGSASASEILAGAIQDHGLGVIIGPAGKNTFGKGSVQTIGELVHTMTDDEDGNPRSSALRLTTARYYTPSGRTIHHIGITPDIGIALTKKHEMELLRHGLLGDVNTGEDYRVPDEEETDPDADVKEGESVLQAPVSSESDEEQANDEAATKESEPSKKDEAAPKKDKDGKFYEIEKPELLEKDEFVDIMLDEAKKQMKIYMILRDKEQKGDVPAIAAFKKSVETSDAKATN